MRFEHETRNAGDFMVKMGLWTPQTPQTLSHISFHAEISRDLTYRHHNVVSFRHHELSHTSRFISFLISCQNPPQSDRGDQELSKTFCGLKIGPLLRKLQASKIGIFSQTPQILLHIIFHAEISWDLTNRHHRLIEETKSFPKLFVDWKSDHY